MANLNLSQFGENTSVSDADYTFVWDSAASISKKVSRNSWLNSGTLTSDAPVTISQTWNAGSNVMTALKVVATDTASGATSNLLELWAGSTPALDFAVTKAGVMQAYGTYSSAGANYARLALACDSSGNATISTQALGTGTAGTVSINGVPVGLGKGNVATNVAVGAGTLVNNTSGSWNSGIGNNTLFANINGSNNSAIGFFALYNNTSGGLNSAVGVSALNDNTTGSENIAIGYRAGRYLANGSSGNSTASASVFLGNETKALGGGEINQIVIGHTATGIGSNSVVLGNDSITKTALKGNVGIGTTAPTAPLEIRGTAVASTRESLLKGTMSDSGNDAFHLYNSTSADGRFSPGFSGSVFTHQGGLGFVGQTTSANDTGTNSLMGFTARITSSETDPNNGTLGSVNTRSLFSWTNHNTIVMLMAANGNLGIGTTAPGAPLHVQATAAATTRESILKCTVSDSGNDAFEIFNGTSADARFAPAFAGANFSNSSNFCLGFFGQTIAGNDTGTAPIVVFAARVTASQTNPNNSTYTDIANRPLFAWYNLATPVMQMAANGNLGIGTTSPTSKLQVSAGDVEVDTIAKGVILKSPDGTRYRVTVANGGTLSVAAV